MVGETTTVVPAKAPGFQVYESAPAAVRVTDPAVQIAVGELEAVTVGVGLTVKETVFVLLQPAALEPVTV